jgi:hypothetical protein
MIHSKFLPFLLFAAIGITACNSESTPAQSQEEKPTPEKQIGFSLEEAKHEINFTAYKTTDKTPVGGQFNTVDIIAGGKGSSIKEAIHQAEFSIPVSSIFTNDKSRDEKIHKFFFMVMDNTAQISGKLFLENESVGYADIKMNNVTARVPFNYVIDANSFSMEGTMDLSNWNTLNALNSLNDACKDLHKGADGISKTWGEVSLNIKSTF